MAAGVIFMKWESYVGRSGNPPFFTGDPLTFNSQQERLHRLAPGDRLWLVSRCPDDGQYYFVAALTVAAAMRNAPDSETGLRYGEYAVACDRGKSIDLGKEFPAEALLRAFIFETDRPIKYGASIGQSLQTFRLLDEMDERVLNTVADVRMSKAVGQGKTACGLWTKCDAVFADYFLNNWTTRRQPQTFLLYDPPPAISAGSPVFIHSDKNLRLVARFLAGQFVGGHKLTVEKDERVAERERVWLLHRASTINPPAKADFDAFWDAQHGLHFLTTPNSHQ